MHLCDYNYILYYLQLLVYLAAQVASFSNCGSLMWYRRCPAQEKPKDPTAWQAGNFRKTEDTRSLIDQQQYVALNDWCEEGEPLFFLHIENDEL
jgi:hypothetical protein